MLMPVPVAPFSRAAVLLDVRAMVWVGPPLLARPVLFRPPVEKLGLVPVMVPDQAVARARVVAHQVVGAAGKRGGDGAGGRGDPGVEIADAVGCAVLAEDVVDQRGRGRAGGEAGAGGVIAEHVHIAGRAVLLSPFLTVLLLKVSKVAVSMPLRTKTAPPSPWPVCGRSVGAAGGAACRRVEGKGVVGQGDRAGGAEDGPAQPGAAAAKAGAAAAAEAALAEGAAFAVGAAAAATAEAAAAGTTIPRASGAAAAAAAEATVAAGPSP